MPQIILSPSDKPRIDALRRKARRHGLRLEKSRQGYHLNNLGGFMLIDAYRNAVIAGADYDLDLEDVESWLNDE